MGVAQLNKIIEKKLFLHHNFKNDYLANLIDIRCLPSHLINRFFSKIAIEYSSQEKVLVFFRALSKNTNYVVFAPRKLTD